MKKLEDIIWNGVENAEKASMNGAQTVEPTFMQVNCLMICCVVIKNPSDPTTSTFGSRCK